MNDRHGVPAKVMFLLVFLLVAISCLIGGCSNGTTPLDSHKTWSKDRYNEMQVKLDAAAKNKDEKTMHLVAEQLDAQLNLEAFILKSREANHPWLIAWGSIFGSAFVSLFVALITVFATRKQR